MLVHGGWTDHTTWDAVAGPLARSFRVVRYDRRGHSRSAYGPGPSPRRRDEDDLEALVEALGSPAHLVGTSYGASISLGARRSPPRTWSRSVVAHEPPLLGVAPDAAAEAMLRGVQDQLAGGDHEAGTRRFFEAILGPGALGVLPEALRRTAMGNAQTFIDLREDPAGRARPRGGGPSTTARSRSPTATRARRGFPAPPVQSPRRSGRHPARRLPGAGHAPHLTTPDALVALVEEVCAPWAAAA